MGPVYPSWWGDGSADPLPPGPAPFPVKEARKPPRLAYTLPTEQVRISLPSTPFRYRFGQGQTRLRDVCYFHPQIIIVYCVILEELSSPCATTVGAPHVDSHLPDPCLL